MTSVPPSVPQGYNSFVGKPHRGTAILVLGILGLVLCQVCAVIAWVMANADLREMDAGRMDPSGRGLTNAGRILGMISIGLLALAVIIWCAFMALAIVAGAGAGTAGL